MFQFFHDKFPMRIFFLLPQNIYLKLYFQSKEAIFMSYKQDGQVLLGGINPDGT